MNPSQRISSSTFLPARDSDSASIRPRNRRLANTKGDDGESSSSCSSSQTPSRGTSTPIPAAHIGSVTGRNDSRTEVAWSRANTNRGTTGGGLLGGGWTPSWASVQELASSIISTGELLINGEPHRPQTRDGSQTWRGGKRSNAKKDNWGPEPPSETRPRSSDIAAGSLAKREAKLKAMKTASVLESHEGVNGGLDFAGKFKRRSSDEELRGKVANEEAEEHLVYVHHVQPTDTYAGLVLKYRCREDAFRKANGLWSRDGVQVRKLLLMPVDACEVRGRPCEPPRDPNAKVDLLAKTPDTSDPWGREDAQEDFFASSTNGNNSASEQQSKSGENDWPWTHVRWVSIDSHPHPVEVARVSRKVLGYFPPRRKKSIHTMSTSSTPRGSFDFPSFTLSQPGPESPRRASSSRRPSLLSSRSQIASSQQSGLPPLSAPGSHSNVQGPDSDPRPAWMRRPGGVGSLGVNVRVPGPQKDYLNNWANKHLPGLNTDSLPSMSVMGSETARFGFTIVDDNAPPAIVESPFREGQDATAASRHGSGLDKAAAAVETWLRGAFERAKSGNVTPILGPRRGGGGVGPGQSGDIAQGDLIELENAASDDGRAWHDSTWDAGGLLGSLPVSAQGASGSNGMSGEAGVRARGSTALQGRKKAD